MKCKSRKEKGKSYSATLRLCCVILSLVMTASAQWINQNVNTTASFRGLSVVSEKIIWASGTGGTVIRTIDGGKKWNVIKVPDAEKLDFRDIEAFDANTAYILSIGNGESSRIYKTIDGGATWQEQFRSKNERAFFDAIACWDRSNCIAMSDPIDSKYVLINTTNGGANWRSMDTSKMPAAKDGEAAFAASGTCLITQGKYNVFLVSGGSDARVFRSNDRGKTWFVADTPIVKGTSGSGIFSIAMFDAMNGVIVGGNYEKPSARNSTFAITSNGGVTWRLGARVNGYRSAVTYLNRQIIITAGTTGADVSYDRRLLWDGTGKDDLNTVAAKGESAIWAVGPKGSVLRLDPNSLTRKHTKFDPAKVEYPHLLNVNSLSLSHSKISTACDPAENECSNRTKITISAAIPEIDIDSPYELLYSVTVGTIVGEGVNVEWDLTGVKPGKYTITAGISIPYFRFSRTTYWDFLGTTQTKVVEVQ